MEFAHERRHAMHLLTSLEDGRLSTADLRGLYEDADPALVHLVFGWLRTRYHGGHSASDGVLGRIVALCAASPRVARAAKTGSQDPISTWFEDSYDYRSLDRDEFIRLVVEKLES